MDTARINRATSILLMACAAFALLTILSALVVPEPPVPPGARPDEGVRAHLFQLSLGAMAPLGLAYLATADWRRPAGALVALCAPALLVAIAMAILRVVESR